MNPLHRLATAALVALLLATITAPARAVTIDWVTVGDPGNTADDTTYGAVADAFRIMKFEWTNSQYVDFLNAVDPDGDNPQRIYNTNMGSDARGGISFDTNASAGSKYAAKTNMGDKPVNFVSWFDAARVANWLQNGAQNYPTTDSSASAPQNTGAYTLGTATGGTLFTRNSGAQYYIPTEDQWYKAAYYKGSGTNAGYWNYATESDTAPTVVTADATGIGSAGSTGNSANFNRGADWNNEDGNVTTVGTNGGSSAYGAFDMSGNVWEWNETLMGANRGIRGGFYLNDASFLSSSDEGSSTPTAETIGIGIRLAAVPEPSTYAMALAGLACGGYLVRWRRKRA